MLTQVQCFEAVVVVEGNDLADLVPTEVQVDQVGEAAEVSDHI